MVSPAGSMSNDEVVRRLDDAVREVREVAAQMREDRKESAATYLRNDVYRAEQVAMRADVADIRKQADDAAANRRQVWLGVLAVALPGLISLGIAVLQLVHGK